MACPIPKVPGTKGPGNECSPQGLFVPGNGTKSVIRAACFNDSRVRSFSKCQLPELRVVGVLIPQGVENSMLPVTDLSPSERTQIHHVALATGKMRMCGSADFGTGSGENYGLRLRLGFVQCQGQRQGQSQGQCQVYSQVQSFSGPKNPQIRTSAFYPWPVALASRHPCQDSE